MKGSITLAGLGGLTTSPLSIHASVVVRGRELQLDPQVMDV
jgi:hypothetical protein